VDDYVVAAPVDVATAIPQTSTDESMLSHFENVFKKFAQADEDDAADNNVEDDGNSSDEMDMDMDDDEDEMTKKLSSRAKRERSRLTVAQLKQLVAHPDVVEDHDVTAADSRLLVHLKSYKCTVPVPKHWCQKRKYLQGTYFAMSVVDTTAAHASHGSHGSHSCPLCSHVLFVLLFSCSCSLCS